MNPSLPETGADRGSAGACLRACKPALRGLLGLLLHYSGALSLARVLRRRRGPRFLVLMYHRVSDAAYGFESQPVSPRKFELQVRYLLKHFEVISLDRLCEYLRSGMSPSRDCVALTFDDGYRDNYENAFPILKKYRVPATIFMTTGFVGGKRGFWWDRLSRVVLALAGRKAVLRPPEMDLPGNIAAALRRLPRLPARKAEGVYSRLESWLKRVPESEKLLILEALERAAAEWLPAAPPTPPPLTWEQAREMCAGGVEMGGHTVTHPILTRVGPVQAREEILRSKADLERELGRTIRHFAYPNGLEGDFDAETESLVKTAGYASAYSAISGVNGPASDLFALNRKYIGDYGAANFALELSDVKEIWRALTRR